MPVVGNFHAVRSGNWSGLFYSSRGSHGAVVCTSYMYNVCVCIYCLNVLTWSSTSNTDVKLTVCHVCYTMALT